MLQGRRNHIGELELLTRYTNNAELSSVLFSTFFFFFLTLGRKQLFTIFYKSNLLFSFFDNMGLSADQDAQSQAGALLGRS